MALDQKANRRSRPVREEIEGVLSCHDAGETGTVHALTRRSACVHSLSEAIESFLLSRRVGNCSAATLRIYVANLARFERTTGATTLADIDTLAVQRYLTGLQATMKPVSVHQHFRTLRTFFRWSVEATLMLTDPMRSIKMRVPKTLPCVPEDEHVQRLLAACSNTFEDRRNKALVALLADSGLRVSEALHLRMGDVNFADRTLRVRGGKGGKDGIGFFGGETVHVMQPWLSLRPGTEPEDFLFVDSHGRPLSRHHACHILHRLSIRAGLPKKIGPHALRHYAASSILRQTGDLYLVREVLRHETLAMTLRYARLNNLDVGRKFRQASPLDRLKAG